MITAESEEEAVRKFGVWKREMETRRLKVNIKKTKLMVMDREPAVRPQRGRYPCGVCSKGVGANSIWCQCCEQEITFSLEIVESFCYLCNVISCGGGVESAIRNRISCTWSKWRELASLLVNHSIPLEERAKVNCGCVRSALL